MLVSRLICFEIAREQSSLLPGKRLPVCDFTYQGRRCIQCHIVSCRPLRRLKNPGVNRRVNGPTTIKPGFTKKLLQADGAAIPGVQQGLLSVIKHFPTDGKRNSSPDHATNQAKFVCVVRCFVVSLAYINNFCPRDCRPQRGALL